LDGILNFVVQLKYCHCVDDNIFYKFMFLLSGYTICVCVCVRACARAHTYMTHARMHACMHYLDDRKLIKDIIDTITIFMWCVTCVYARARAYMYIVYSAFKYWYNFTTRKFDYHLNMFTPDVLCCLGSNIRINLIHTSNIYISTQSEV